MNAPDPDQPCTPPKSIGNGGAGRVDPDGQMESEDDDSFDLQVAKPKRKWNGKTEWTLMKERGTGQKLDKKQIWSKKILIGSCLNLHVNEWQCPSLGRFPAMLQTTPMLLCGSSFVGTQSRRVQYLSYCFDDH